MLMHFSTSVSLEFHAEKEWVFKTPILGDAIQFFPKVGSFLYLVGFEADTSWGKVGGSRIPIVSRFLWWPEKKAFYDEIIERRENEYWKWRLTDFTSPFSLMVKKAEGEMHFTSTENSTQVKWTYSFWPTFFLLSPFVWFFTKIMWRWVMKKSIRNMYNMTEAKVPLVYKS